MGTRNTGVSPRVGDEQICALEVAVYDLLAVHVRHLREGCSRRESRISGYDRSRELSAKTRDEAVIFHNMWEERSLHQGVGAS